MVFACEKNSQKNSLAISPKECLNNIWFLNRKKKSNEIGMISENPWQFLHHFLDSCPEHMSAQDTWNHKAQFEKIRQYYKNHIYNTCKLWFKLLKLHISSSAAESSIFTTTVKSMFCRKSLGTLQQHSILLKTWCFS